MVQVELKPCRQTLKLPTITDNMAMMAVGQPPVEVRSAALTATKEPAKVMYANTIKPQYKPIPLKQITYLHGEPRIVWEEEEVSQMIINKDLQYAVIWKFSYGWPEIQDLRRLIPRQCELKGEVNIGLLSNRYILIRVTRLDDFVNLLSKPQFYITQLLVTSNAHSKLGSIV